MGFYGQRNKGGMGVSNGFSFFSLHDCIHFLNSGFFAGLLLYTFSFVSVILFVFLVLLPGRGGQFYCHDENERTMVIVFV
jgi:hypothetical protein